MVPRRGDAGPDSRNAAGEWELRAARGGEADHDVGEGREGGVRPNVPEDNRWAVTAQPADWRLETGDWVAIRG